MSKMSNLLLVVILFLQVYFFSIVFSSKIIDFSGEMFLAISNMLLTVIGWWTVYWFGFRKSKKEISINQKMDIYDKIIHQNIDKVLESYYEFAALTMNKIEIKECDLRGENDFCKTMLKNNSAQLIKVQSNFLKNFQRMNDLFQAWKPLFSKKVDYESKFLFRIAISLHGDMCKYQRSLSDYLSMYINKNKEELDTEKNKVIELEKQINRQSDLFANAIEKFILDMSKEVFDGLYSNEDEKRLFSLEIENVKDRDKIEMLTRGGIKKVEYQETEFQKKFGSMLKNR